LRILHCIGFFDKNYLYREYYYTKYLSEIPGNQVYILTSNKSYPFKHEKKTSFKPGVYKSGKIIIIRKFVLLQYTDWVFFLYKRIIDRINPDVLHFYECRQYITYKVAKYCSKKNIRLIYEHEQRDMGSSLLGRIRAVFFTIRWLKKIMPYVDKVRVVTPGGKKFLLDNVNSSITDKIAVETLAYDKHVFFLDRHLREKYRKENKLDDNIIVIGTTGKFYPAKKIEVIINAFLETKRDDLFLIIMGVGEDFYVKRIKEMIINKKQILFVKKFLNKDNLNIFFNGIDYALWTMPTISFFEAIGTNLKIIIPSGQGTSHLQGENFIFFGKESGMNQDFTSIMDNHKIQSEITMIFKNLKKYNREAKRDTHKYEITYVVKNLLRLYQGDY